MRISVITPVYNGAKYIEETVLSVLKASEGNEIEYLVIDDGSTDGTKQILDKYSSRIKVIHQPNAGESAAVNTGFREASGDFVLVVSADDPLFTPAIFVGIIEFFDLNPEVVAWYPNWNMIDQYGNFVRKVEVDEFSDERLIGRFICLPGPGAFIRKSAALKIGGRREKWKYVGDYDFWLRISRVGKLLKRDAVVAQWRFHDQSTSISQRGNDMAVERVSVVSEFLQEHPIDQGLANMAMAHSYYYAARLSFFDSKVNGKALLRKAFASNSGRIKDGKFLVYIYILSLPLSRVASRFLMSFFKIFARGPK